MVIHARSVRPTWAEISLDAYAKNLQTLGKLTKPAEICAVVKAHAYGHGDVRLAKAAVEHGVRFLAVALVEEGRALREGGIDGPILILSGPFVDAPDEVVHNELTPSVYTHEAVEAIATAVRKAGRHSYPVHVKIDTGMNRAGVRLAQAMDIVSDVMSRRELSLQGVFTHFANADDVNHELNHLQLNCFEDILDTITKTYERPAIVHAANSAAAISIPEARYDMVRLGLATYGISPIAQSPFSTTDLGLLPVMSIKSRATYLRWVDEGETVSYGSKYRTRTRSQLCTIPIGYADGIPRSLGLNGGQVLIGGQRLPIAGAVTMDQLVIDCGDADIHVGDEVVLLGSQGENTITVDEIADRSNEIPYTVIAAMSGRLPRKYL